MRDIDYAAVAVQKAIVEKFGRKSELENLSVTVCGNTISVDDGEKSAQGSRDALLAGVRQADSYDRLWEILSAPKPTSR
jgi:hypothetical protein